MALFQALGRLGRGLSTSMQTSTARLMKVVETDQSGEFDLALHGIPRVRTRPMVSDTVAEPNTEATARLVLPC
jgi:hypothetical protein